MLWEKHLQTCFHKKRNLGFDVHDVVPSVCKDLPVHAGLDRVGLPTEGKTPIPQLFVGIHFFFLFSYVSDDVVHFLSSSYEQLRYCT